MNLCECGCGKEVSKDGNKFLKGHWVKTKDGREKTGSKEARQKISLAKTGKHRSDETKIKISKSRRGQCPSEETKRKMRESQTGRITSKETKRKLSEAKSGDKHPNFGKYGKLNPNYKDGRTLLTHRIRQLFKSKEWIQNIFQRDDFTCQICGKRGVYLHAHHMKPFALIFHENDIKMIEEADKCEEFWDIDNGITLCKKCHNKEHCSS